MAAVLGTAGSDMSKIVKVNVFLRNWENFEIMNKTYLKHFTLPMPVSPTSSLKFEERGAQCLLIIEIQARTCVGVSALPFGAEVEIECVAAL
jgi:enamine deaminase RidA (YjgF/YER057c/UK114 family)